MKPRTFRRVVLLGSLGGIVLLVAFGYFVVRPWQNQRQLEASRTEGIAAYESGDYPKAVGLLGRYKRSSENPEADALLMHARASEKVEATDLGNYAVAVDSYREYLRRNPGDVEAMRELLPLMNLRGMFIEAEGLARELLDEHRVDDIEVLEQLFLSLTQQQVSDEELEPVLSALFEHEDSTIRHVNTYATYLRGWDRGDEADALLEERIAAYPDRVDERLLELQREFGGTEAEPELSDEDVLNEICSIIGLDPNEGTWSADAPALSPDVAQYVNRLFNLLLRPELATTVQLRSATLNGDYQSTTWAARRLYWSGRDEELNAMSVETEKGEPDVDMLGYQYLSAVRAEDEERAGEIEEQIRGIVLDRRGAAWSAYINALDAIEAEDNIRSRVEMQEAIDAYRAEPSFRLSMGELQLAQGRFNEAIEQWVIASEIVNDPVGTQLRAGTNAWIDPLTRIIEAYGAQGRLVEAIDYIQELQRVAPQDFRSVFVVLSTLAELARLDQMPPDIGRVFVDRWSEVKDTILDEQRAVLSGKTASILASMGRTEEAREEIRFGLQRAQDEPRVIAEVIQADERYRLGVAESLGIDTDSVMASSPAGALQAASRAYATSGLLEDGLRILDRGLENASADDSRSWERVRLSYLDRFATDRAQGEWEQQLEANPNDVELIYSAIESRAFMSDLDRIDQLIDRVTALTETQGRGTPSRLRLARANAMVSGEGKQTRSNRESALGIVRAVVAAEPANTKARNMLGRLLALPPSPGTAEAERYEPDPEGAIEQYVTLSRQLNGREAQNYLIESVELAYRMDDEQRALSLLDEYEARFADNLAAMPRAAEWFENLGEIQRAIAIYERVLRERGDPYAALALADLLQKRGETTRCRDLLAVVRDVESLTEDGVLRLASLYARLGDQQEGELVASSGEQYGLDPIDAKLLQARFAAIYLSSDREIELLREATEIEPKSQEAWKRLVLRLIRMDRTDEAEAAYTRATQLVSADEELTRYGMMLRDTPQTAEEMMRLPGMQDDPRLGQVVRLVESYDTLPDDAPVGDRVNLLRQIINDFPNIEPAQIYGAEQATALAVNPAVTAELSFEALRNAPWNTKIMQIAGQSHLRANDAEGALRAVRLWQANSLETTIVANAIRARALILSGDLQAAQQELEPFVDQALGNPSDPVSREVLDAYSYIRLSLGEDPAQTAERLRPLIASDPFIRNQTWLRLASSVVRDPEIGAEWIRTAEGYTGEDDGLALASAWVTLAFTHERWDPGFAEAALEHLDPMMGDNPGPEPLVLAARANIILARAMPEIDDARSEYETIVNLMTQASTATGGNVGLILDAARYANEGRLYERAAELYNQILEMNIQEPVLNALVRNNLAMTMLRSGLEASEKDRVLEMVRLATEAQGDQGSFWGTRGWIELELGMTEAAQESFTRCAQLSPSNPEGWVGLAIVYHKLGDEFGEDKSRALREVRRLASDSGLSSELQSYLEANGLTDWESEPSP